MSSEDNIDQDWYWSNNQPAWKADLIRTWMRNNDHRVRPSADTQLWKWGISGNSNLQAKLEYESTER